MHVRGPRETGSGQGRCRRGTLGADYDICRRYCQRAHAKGHGVDRGGDVAVRLD